MQPMDAARADLSPVELRPSTSLSFLIVLPVAGLGVLRAALQGAGPGGRLLFVVGLVDLGLLVMLLVLWLVALVRRRAAGWRLRLDTSGVTVRGHETVPWSDLSEVRLVLLSAKLPRQALVFVPRPGVVLPAMPVSWPLSRPRARADRLIGKYGSPIVVEPLLMGTTVERLGAAVRRLGGLPITG
ncbi:hypothetical protein GCM10009665_28680 [Kitasatospora nipponensis]|uniref:PH (Pleckstrin Homology) domain-containing protein n=1 Tax=Kitasatospora nipponensis TaxID=258049 RepID=A0ABN1W9U8_9ACTN